MAFRESSPVEERIALMRALESGAFSVSELACRFGVSRETVYVWKRCREAGGTQWFEDLSRAPGHCPHATSAETAARICRMRERYPHFGPKKIRARLALDAPEFAWPSASTIGNILRRHGLVVPRKRRRRPLEQGSVIAGATEPNGEWAIDF